MEAKRSFLQSSETIGSKMEGARIDAASRFWRLALDSANSNWICNFQFVVEFRRIRDRPFRNMAVLAGLQVRALMRLGFDRSNGDRSNGLVAIGKK